MVSDSGVHLHHLVFGIVTMMVAGTLGFLFFGHSPQTEIAAAFFGIGAGLTIDEFALWVHLDDVYWAEEGRSSIDATVIAAAGMRLILLGFSPVAIETGSASAVIGSVLTAVLLFAWVVDLLRQGARPARHGRLLHLPDRALRRLPARQAGLGSGRGAATASGGRTSRRKAEARFPPDRRTERFKNAFRDIVGGKPSEGVTAATEEAFAATREATEEMRQRAERVAHAADPTRRDKD